MHIHENTTTPNNGLFMGYTDISDVIIKTSNQIIISGGIYNSTSSTRSMALKVTVIYE